MGSKYRLLDLVVPAVNGVARHDAPIIDLMAGTHAVGYALRSDRVVVANDIQAYSEIFGKALLLNTQFPHVRNRMREDLGPLKTTNSSEGWFSETYADTYFSYEQCREIEEVRARVSHLTDEVLAAIYLTALIFAMGRCQASPGHFAQFMPSDHERVRLLRAKSIIEAFETRCMQFNFQIEGPRCHLFRREAGQLLSDDCLYSLAPEGSAVYFDPPYTTAQYSRYYHLLETVVLNDEPEVLHKAKYRNDRHQSNFCSSSKAASTFGEFFEKISDRGWNLVVSYSSHGVVPIRDLIELTRTRYSKVEVQSRNHAHSMQGRGQVSDRLEYVISAKGPQ
jgi:adenine-specific DNA-methyltransferase